jgi:(E)-4-hydroxy-3-methylbut-2-enyl-diphosphate synthase
MYKRTDTRAITLGKHTLGQGNPIRVQSMLKIPLDRTQAAIAQARRLEDLDCEIIRVAIPDERTLLFLDSLLERVSTPIVADIHFDYRLALGAIEKGVAGLRINPGNIGSRERIAKVVAVAKERAIPIRIGVNSGSLERSLLQKYGGPTAQAMVDSALKHIRILEKLHFDQVKVSLKASSVLATIEAYQRFAETVDYPLHIGITEAGPPGVGTVKSSVGLGILLAQGLGDTLRISLTGPPEEEVKVGYEILKCLGLREHGPTLISCPTCGRCSIDILPIVREVEKALETISEPMTVAVMGCVVNGPGEAKEADVGIAGGKDHGLLFKKGQKIGKYPQDQLLPALLAAIQKIRHT